MTSANVYIFLKKKYPPACFLFLNPWFFKLSGGVRLFPVLEKVFVASAYEIDGIDDGRYWEFASSQY
mgnify:CR=1 FL=1